MCTAENFRASTEFLLCMQCVQVDKRRVQGSDLGICMQRKESPLPAITVSTEKWPVVHQVFDGQQTDQDISQFMRAWEEIMQRGKPCVILSEIRQYSSNPAHVKRLGEWAMRVESQMRAICLGGAFVSNSGVFRFVLSSFLLLAPMPYEYTIVKDRGEAAEWLKAKAKESGLILPPQF